MDSQAWLSISTAGEQVGPDASDTFTPSTFIYTPHRSVLEQLGVLHSVMYNDVCEEFGGRCACRPVNFPSLPKSTKSIKFHHIQTELNLSAAFRAWLLGLVLLEAREC